MHSRKRGKAGSVKPQDGDLRWVTYNQKEIEMLISKLAKKGLSAAQIGLQLRDEYGIPDVREVAGKKVSKIMKDKKVAKELPDDLGALIKKFIAVRKHLERNGQDKSAKRGEQLTFSKIRRLGKYYKGKKVLAEDWRFRPKEAEMMVE